MQLILAATDFSQAAENACRYAAAMANSYSAELVLFHCYIPPITLSDSALTIDFETEKEKLARNLEEVAADLQSSFSKIKKVNCVVGMGSVSVQLEEAIDEFEPDLVIMGSQGRSGIEKFLFGSNSIHAMRNLSRPLLLIPTKCTYQNIDSLAVATEFSNIEETFPAQKLKQLSVALNLHKIDILHAESSEKLSSELISGTAWIKKSMQPVEVKAVVLPAHDQQIDNLLFNYIEENNISLLAVIPRQLHFFERLFLRSESARLSGHSIVPVLSVRG